MKSRIHLALMLMVMPILVLATVAMPRQPASASSASLSFATWWGSPDFLRTVSYSGFAASEALDFTFYDPTGAQAMVGPGTTYYASTESDGTGVFPFRPSDWFTNPANGFWTVQVVGETSGISLSTWFYMWNGNN